MPTVSCLYSRMGQELNECYERPERKTSIVVHQVHMTLSPRLVRKGVNIISIVSVQRLICYNDMTPALRHLF